MSQVIFNDINPGTTSGTELASALNAFKAAIMSGLCGATRPTALLANGIWVDDSQKIANNILYLKLYNGTSDIVLFTINIATNSISLPGTSESFDITKISGDTVGAVLKLVKRRASSAQVESGDVIGEIQYVGRDNDTPSQGNPIGAKIKAIALETMTASAAGVTLVFEQIKATTTSLVEVARFLDGKLGIGLTAPTGDLHVRGNNTVIFERVTDDATAAIVSASKKRATGNGGVQNADGIGTYRFRSNDSSGTVFTAASLDAVAGEAHTATNRGTNLSLKITKAAEAALTEVMTFGSEVYAKVAMRISALILDAQDIATAATIATLNTDKPIVNFTGSTDTAVQSLSATGKSKVVLLYNGSTAKITVNHENGSATAANRITLPNSRDSVLLPGQSVELFYNETKTRWTLKSGSGGGGGDIVAQADATVTNGGTIAISQTDPQQVIKVTASGAVIASTTPFGGSSGPASPVAFTMIGADNTNPVALVYSDADYGCVGNFDATEGIQITKDFPVKVLWVPATKRYYVSRGV